MRIYIATTVDTGDTCDGRARVLGVYLNRKDAVDAVNKDMGGIMNHLSAQGKSYTQGTMSVDTAGGDMGFLWNIEEKEVEIPQPKKVERAEQAARELLWVVNDYDTEGIRIILNRMLNEHPTLEQMFTNRFIIPFVRKMAERLDKENYDLRNAAACNACNAMWKGLKQDRGISDGDAVNLPMI